MEHNYELMNLEYPYFSNMCSIESECRPNPQPTPPYRRSMPKPLPLPQSTRDEVVRRIHAGEGRNAIARALGISPGSVTNIAQAHGLWFERSAWTAEATTARQIDQWVARIDREEDLLNQYLALKTTMNRARKPTRAEKRLSYALYNTRRHHNGTYR